MSQENAITRPPLSAWQTELIRLTAFPGASTNVLNQNWWEELMGERPTKYNKDLKKQEQTDEGPFKNGRLILAVTPLRIDWIYRTVEDESEEPMKSLPIVGSFEQTLKDFTELITPWFSKGDLIVSRLAFGCILLQEADDPSAAYRLVSSYLPFEKGNVLDSQSVSDFVYRINRKKQSDVVKELVINRLSSWNAIALRSLQIVSTGNRTIRQDLAEPLYAARVELDINTSADYETDLPPNNLSNLFQELIDAGTEIAIYGDRA